MEILITNIFNLYTEAVLTLSNILHFTKMYFRKVSIAEYCSKLSRTKFEIFFQKKKHLKIWTIKKELVF